MRISSSAEKTFLEKVFATDGFSEHDGALLADTLVDADLRAFRPMGFNGWLGTPA